MSRRRKASATQKLSRCRWPDCNYRAVTEIKRGPMPFIQLCRGHRPMWDLLTDTALRQMEWEPRRRLGGHS